MAETLKKGTRVTGADREKLAADLKKRYSAGESIRALAASTGRSVRVHPPHPERVRGDSARARRRDPGQVQALEIHLKTRDRSRSFLQEERSRPTRQNVIR